MISAEPTVGEGHRWVRLVAAVRARQGLKGGQVLVEPWPESRFSPIREAAWQWHGRPAPRPAALLSHFPPAGGFASASTALPPRGMRWNEEPVA